MVPALSAVSFLTRLPVPSSVHTDEAALRKAPGWFPLVGVLLGSIYAGSAFLLLHRVSTQVVAALLLGLDALLTGALHLDGLADMADGFGGGRTRDDVLRIMRDHAIGSYGCVAIATLLLVKVSCLSQLLEQPGGLVILFIAPAVARWSILFLSSIAPYARADSASGSGALMQAVSKRQLLFASLCCLALIALDPLRAAVGWLSVIALSLFIAYLSKRKINGVTGDVLGATVVLAEALQFLMALLVSRR